jgi:glycosyltransferase involved in cell wall biosynthesis
MTILLLTDMPPCSNFTAGLVTAQMCRAIHPDTFVVFSVLNQHLTPELFDDLAGVTQKVVRKPNEVGVRQWKGLAWGEFGSGAIEFARRTLKIPPLVREAVAFGREHRVDRVWAVLEGQTMVRMALPVARKLGASLHLHVWDPLSWWHDAHKVDRFNAWLDRAMFNRTMRAGVSCASASWAMTEHFSRLYGIRGEPIIAALPVGWMRCPPPRLHSANELVIGMAGQFYARQECLTFVKALSDVGWEVAGRRVMLRVMGGAPPPGEIPQDRLDFLGWRSQEEVVDILSERCDLLYCGYPFSQEMAEVARFSFPSKLPTFFCAGRPVLFHGPIDSSPGEYLKRQQAAYLVGESSESVLEALNTLVEDEARYASLARSSTEAFLKDFTLERQRGAVRRFLLLTPDVSGG